MQKLRENRETIQKLTSQLQEMQEQMNAMSDSGDFQGVESIYTGRSSHVSSQPAMILSSRSMLSLDKRLPLLTHGINLDYRKSFWKSIYYVRFLRNTRITRISSTSYRDRDLIHKDHPQRIQSDDVQRNREAVPVAGRTKTVHASEDRVNQGTIPMPTFATKPLTTSSTTPVELPHPQTFSV